MKIFVALPSHAGERLSSPFLPSRYALTPVLEVLPKTVSKVMAIVAEKVVFLWLPLLKFCSCRKSAALSGGPQKRWDM